MYFLFFKCLNSFIFFHNFLHVKLHHLKLLLLKILHFRYIHYKNCYLKLPCFKFHHFRSLHLKFSTTNYFTLQINLLQIVSVQYTSLKLFYSLSYEPALNLYIMKGFCKTNFFNIKQLHTQLLHIWLESNLGDLEIPKGLKNF